MEDVRRVLRIWAYGLYIWPVEGIIVTLIITCSKCTDRLRPTLGYLALPFVYFAGQTICNIIIDNVYASIASDMKLAFDSLEELVKHL